MIIRRIEAAEKAAFRPMLDAYLTEEAAQHGIFEPQDFPNFEKYWAEPWRRPWWVLDDGQPAGFGLISRFSWSGLPSDHALIEFYVEPGSRRRGLGLQAARALFRETPGLWELQVSRKNPGGQAFWPRAIAVAGGREADVIEGAENVIHRFRV